MKVENFFSGEWFYRADFHQGTLRGEFSRGIETGSMKSRKLLIFSSFTDSYLKINKSSYKSTNLGQQGKLLTIKAAINLLTLDSKGNYLLSVKTHVYIPPGKFYWEGGTTNLFPVILGSLEHETII